MLDCSGRSLPNAIADAAGDPSQIHSASARWTVPHLEMLRSPRN
jgi:hypothetical protein